MLWQCKLSFITYFDCIVIKFEFIKSRGLRLSKFAFLPFRRLFRGVKILSGLRYGDLRLSKFAFLPFCLLSGGGVK